MKRSTRHGQAPQAPASRRPSAILDVVAVALLASFVGVRNQFAHDDLHLVQENARVHDLGALREILASPFWPPPFSQDLWRPLTTLLMAVEYVIGGGAPFVFRIVSYALYAMSAVAVLWLARRYVAHPAALGTAILFAAHPVHVEAVALAVGQAEIVVGLLATIATILYVRWRDTGTPTAMQWVQLAALYGAAALFKENALVIPGLLIAAELLLPRAVPTDVRRLAPGVAALVAVAAVILLLRVQVLGELRGTFVAEALDGATPFHRVLTALRVVPEWIRLLVWPAHLRLDYSPQEFVASTAFGPMEALGLAMLAAGATLAWWTRRSAPLVSFGLAWMAVALFPVSNVVVPTGILIAERTLFLPSVGFMLCVAGGIHWLRPALATTQRRRFAQAGFAVLAAAGVLRSAERHRVWRHDGFLAVRTASDAPRSFRAQRAYADALFEIGQVEAAHRAYAKAISLSPPALQWRVRNDYARRLRARGDRAAEAEQLAASLALRPDQHDEHGHLVAAYLALGRYADAARQADSAMAHGAPRDVFAGFRELADSAARVDALPGSVRVQLNTEPRQPR